MHGIATAIMDTAERRIRTSGFNGFSFREIAADVGVKSSSVHYHFPTKESLAAAVIHRYTNEVSEQMDQRMQADQDTVRVWIEAFRGTLLSPGRLCPCTVLGACALDLPDQVAAEVRLFFEMCLNKIVKHGLTRDKGAALLSMLTGATILAVATGDRETYDRAIRFETGATEAMAAVA